MIIAYSCLAFAALMIPFIKYCDKKIEANKANQKVAATSNKSLSKK